MLQPMPSDVKETKDAFEFVVDAPGVKKDDVKVEVRKRDGLKSLHIFMERKGTSTTDTETSHRTERYSGKLHRWFPLPSEVKDDAISAKCTDGVLHVNVPKLAETAVAADVKCVEVK